MPETDENTPNRPDATVSPADIRKMNRKLAVSIYLRTIFAAVLCFIIYTSITIIVSAVGTKKIGTQIYEVGKDGEAMLVSEVRYDTTSPSAASSTDTAGTGAAAADSSGAGKTGTTATSAKGTKTSSSGSSAASASTYQMEIRTKLSPSAELTSGIISQVLLLMMLIIMPYMVLWERGDKDCNSVHFGHMKEDKLRGLKVGLMAGIPSYLAYFLLLLSKLGWLTPSYAFLYRFLNLAFIPVFNGLIGKAQTTAGISWGGMAVLLLTVAVVPLTGFVAYFLGYKQISLSEKIIYVDPNKKKKRRRY